MKASINKPILVTGSHRSGSTWVGKMLAESPQAFYIHEPFNITHPPGVGICRAQFVYWYTCISSENEAQYYSALKDTIKFSYSTLSAIGQIRSSKQIKKIAREYRQFNQCRTQSLRPLLKDPLALFSAEWLASRFEADVIMLIRHPAAFVSSLKRKNWQFPFSHFLQQPQLLQDLPESIQAEIVTYTHSRPEIVDQAILLWKICHSHILRCRSRYSDWLFVRHEDLSMNPLAEFSTIYERLNLDFTPEIKAVILEHSNPDNPREAENNATHTLKRNSQENIKNWQHRLSSVEIKHIREQVEPIAAAFYTDADW